ncbi:hypothetical protein ZWY2020_025432 [Hordeum vulgare]|nr:hypothetical protein ZWY2020_025432 [Hordeum vulgare]
MFMGRAPALLALHGHTADLRAAVRRRDPVKLASAARAQRRAAKDLAGLAAAVARCVPVHTHATSSSSSGVEVAALADAAAATALASSSATSPKTRLTLVGDKGPAGGGEDTHRDTHNLFDVMHMRVERGGRKV